MILLMTSKLLIWWLFLHAFIYTLYAIWDFLTVCDWKPKYYYATPEGREQTVGGVYIGGLSDSADVNRGPIITIVWGLYFWALYILNDRVLHWLNVPELRDRIVGTTLFVLAGLNLYRRDKLRPASTNRVVPTMRSLSSGTFNQCRTRSFKMYSAQKYSPHTIVIIGPRLTSALSERPPM